MTLKHMEKTRSCIEKHVNNNVRRINENLIRILIFPVLVPEIEINEYS